MSYWNHYEVINPAASGVFHKIKAASSYSVGDLNPNFISRQSFVSSFSADIEKINSGIGILYHWKSDIIPKSKAAGLNYAFYFRLNDERKLSLGLSAGFIKKTMEENILFISSNDPDDKYDSYSSTDYWNAYGITYATPRLRTGIAARFNLSEELSVDEEIFNAFFDYKFLLSEKFEIQSGFYAKSRLTPANLYYDTELERS
ncbi:MAG: type IX secretion system membrane protein PorP/SprF [Bacteroidales bacterium]|nr:type IX secretion system membrane protein PorP/SprF [Bacteroidales bacterium]